MVALAPTPTFTFFGFDPPSHPLCFFLIPYFVSSLPTPLSLSLERRERWMASIHNTRHSFPTTTCVCIDQDRECQMDVRVQFGTAGYFSRFSSSIYYWQCHLVSLIKMTLLSIWVRICHLVQLRWHHQLIIGWHHVLLTKFGWYRPWNFDDTSSRRKNFSLSFLSKQTAPSVWHALSWYMRLQPSTIRTRRRVVQV